jgi:uncharacterized protein YbjT (DUF2867 family)
MILITGATGHVGRELVAQLAARGEEVRAMTRRPEAAHLADGVEIVQGDFDDPASVERALAGVDRLFLMSAQPVGSSDGPSHDLTVVDAARRASVAHIVMLSVLGGGGDDPSDPIARWHRIAETAVRQSGASWTLLRPGRFMSNALQWAPAIRRGGKVYVPFASRPAAPIDPADIARVALHALTEPGHDARAYELSGPEILTPAGELDILAATIGRSLDIVDVPPEAARDGMVRGGMPPGVADAILARIAAGDHGAAVLPTVQQVTGRLPHTFAVWASVHAAEFR